MEEKARSLLSALHNSPVLLSLWLAEHLGAREITKHSKRCQNDAREVLLKMHSCARQTFLHLPSGSLDFLPLFCASSMDVFTKVERGVAVAAGK